VPVFGAQAQKGITSVFQRDVSAFATRGDYTPIVDLHVNDLLPFSATPVDRSFQPSKPMHVFGGSAVKLLFQVPAFAVAGSPTDFSFNPGAGGAGDNASAYPFVVRVGLQNLTDFPVYLPSVSLFDLANDPTRQSPPDTYGPH